MRIFCELLPYLIGAWAIGMTLYTTYGSPWGELLGAWLPSNITAPSLITLSGHAARLIALLGICAVMAGNGSWAIRRLTLPIEKKRDRLILGFGLGYGLWGTALHIMGLAGLWYRPLMIGILIAAAWPAFQELKGLFPKIKRPSPWPAHWPLAAAAALIGIHWILHLPSVLIPETFYDAQGYHLGLPDLYLLRHAITPTPENSYAGIPSIPMMVYGLCLAVDPWGILAQLMHSATTLWVAAAAFILAEYIAPTDSRKGTWLAAAIFSFTPVVFSESIRVSVGMEWALFQTLCLYAFIAARDSATSKHRSRWMLLCGSFAGFAMATKYPAWSLPAALGVGALYDRYYGGGKWHLRETGIAAAAALSLLAPWLIRNIVFYDNPIYPFLHETLVPDSNFLPNWTILSSGRLNLHDVFFTANGLKNFFLRPWAFSRHAQEVGAAIGPLYLGLLPLLFFPRIPPRIKLLGVLCLAAWIPLNAVSSITRFFIPILAPLSALLAAAYATVPSGRGRTVLGASIITALIATNAAYYSFAHKRWGNLEIALHKEKRWDYLSHENWISHYPSPPHIGFKEINDSTPAGGKVLIFGDARHYLLKRDRIASSADQVSVLEIWANQSQNDTELRRRFTDAGITHILINHAEIFRNKNEFHFTARGLQTLDSFWKKYTERTARHAKHADYWVEIFRILNDEESLRPHTIHGLWDAYKITQ